VGASLLAAGSARGQVISGGGYHSLSIVSGSIEAWGYNRLGQCNAPAASGFVAVAGGFYHSVALKSDGTIAAWGDDRQAQCTLPVANTGFIAVGAGQFHTLAVKAGGSVVSWGYNMFGQCNPPFPNSGFIAVAGGYGHSVGLKSDGTIVAWGDNSSGQCDVPLPNANFVAVASGSSHTLGLKSDGSIVAWGSNTQGQCSIPPPNAGFVAVAAGGWHSIGLKSDGTIVAWGDNSSGQCTIPQPNEGFVAIGAGYSHTLGLKSGGVIVAWGSDAYRQCEAPGSQQCPHNILEASGTGAASYDAAGGNLYVDATASACDAVDGDAYVDVMDDFVIRNLPTETLVTLTGHLDWSVDAGGLCGQVNYQAPIFPTQVRVGEPFRIRFSASASALACGDFCEGNWASVYGHLWFSDLPPGAVVTSCQGFVQGDLTAVDIAPVEEGPMAINRLGPNPSRDSFGAWITLPTDSPASLDVFDVSGRLVTHVPVKGTGRVEQEVDIRTRSRLPAGIYFVRLSQGKRSVCAKQTIMR